MEYPGKMLLAYYEHKKTGYEVPIKIDLAVIGTVHFQSVSYDDCAAIDLLTLRSCNTTLRKIGHLPRSQVGSLGCCKPALMLRSSESSPGFLSGIFRCVE